jgi:hypothetical protein
MGKARNSFRYTCALIDRPQATAVLRTDFRKHEPRTPRGNAVLPKLPALLDAAERRRYVRRDPATGSVQQAPSPGHFPGRA